MNIDIRRDTSLAFDFVPDLLYTDGVGSSDDVFHVEFDTKEETVIEVVTRSVAAIRGKSVLDLKPLGVVIDPDILEAVVDEGSQGMLCEGSFSFTYEGFRITVDTVRISRRKAAQNGGRRIAGHWAHIVH